jgi:hypothetical protein
LGFTKEMWTVLLDGAPVIGQGSIEVTVISVLDEPEVGSESNRR